MISKHRPVPRILPRLQRIVKGRRRARSDAPYLSAQAGEILFGTNPGEAQRRFPIGLRGTQSRVGRIAVSVFLGLALTSLADTQVLVDRNSNDEATAAFHFEHVPSPVKNDAAEPAHFTVVSGESDQNGGGLDKLNDGKLATEEDDPGASFFFRAGTAGGRLMLDLGKVIPIKQVNSYSWHPGARGPQVYHLYASDGQAPNFSAQPKAGVGPEELGWKSIARIDTHSTNGEPGGQYGVSIQDSAGTLGKYRYLLFDISQTESEDAFGNTFYSEIDVLEADAKPAPEPIAFADQTSTKTYEAANGKYHIVVDTSAAPGLAEWVDRELVPVVQVWYPKLIAMLPSDGYEPATRIKLIFKPGQAGVPAAAGGNRITCNSTWFEKNLQGEAKGSVVHELVHVIQHYGRPRGENAVRPPGWLVEGIADYLRWFRYEPESHGAEISRERLSRARYDASYRITANFLNWATEKYNPDLVPRLNAAIRQGQYNPSLWKELTGHTVQDLGAEWRAALEQKLGVQAQ
jgi:hypothetical protein